MTVHSPYRIGEEVEVSSKLFSRTSVVKNWQPKPEVMSSRKTLVAALLMAMMCTGHGYPSQNLPQQASQLDQPSMTRPSIFGEGVISTENYESHPAFTPNGETLYFLLSTPSFNHWTIVLSRFKEGKWTTPEVASFSGQFDDADPFVSRDGSKFFFISNRPVDGKRKSDLDIWMMERGRDGWGEPRHLEAAVNSGANEWFPTLADDGTLYFGSERPGGKGGTDIYRCRFVNGKYAEAENLGDAINSRGGEFEPLISPDQNFMIFAAVGRPDGFGSFDLYISYRGGDNVWSKAVNLGSNINTTAIEFSPSISPDSKYMD